jgi:hypothetical protein
MSYLSQRRSAHVSRHVVESITRDEHEATVYVQTWTHRQTGASTTFDVLAFPDQAEDHGCFRLAGMPGAEHAIAHMVLTENRAVIDASWDRRRAIVAVEDFEEGETRRREWKRHEDGPEDSSGGSSASERIERGYDALEARRR